MRRIAALILVAAAGCATCEEDPKFLFDMGMGRDFYRTGKFGEAMRKYEDAIEKCRTSYNAVVGLGSASREWGLQKFEEAEDLYRVKKVDLAKKEYQKAANVHAVAQKLFLKAIQMRPDDPLAHRELGMLFYKRATSPYGYPYPVEDRKNRGAELDEAIRYLTFVVKKEPKEYFAQRYIGLAYFTKGKTNQGREHLALYLQGVAAARAYLLRRAKRRTAAERKELERRLYEIDKELDEIRGVLAVHAGNLEAERAKVRRTGGSEELVAALTKEILALRSLLAQYEEAKKKPE